MSRNTVFDEIGMTPAEMHESLRKFSEETKALADLWDELIKTYPDQWIAFHDKHVASHADTLDEIVSLIDKEGLPRNNVIFRYVESEPTTLIL